MTHPTKKQLAAFHALSPAEQYTMNTWLAREAMHTGTAEPVFVPPEVEPHPNEVAARAAVDAGLFTAEQAGL